MIGRGNIDQVKMKAFFLKFKPDLLAILSLSLLSPLFFYKLGQSSLVSWDEAWYAEIARNILKSGDLFHLYWNGYPYYDHPVAGFWGMAIVFKLLGISNFSARLFPAICGLFSIYFTYFLGKELFGRLVGFMSAVALSSSFWFLYRARSGNLDVILTMFFILTILMAIKAIKNPKYKIPFAISLGLLFLTKTLVPITIILPLLIIFWPKKITIGSLKKEFKKWFIPAFLFIGLVGSYVLMQIWQYPDYFNRYFQIGLPQIKLQTSYIGNFQLMKEYLHNGIGKWFWPGLLGIFASAIFFRKKFLIFPALFLMFLPFILSSKGHIWHLIPLYPFMILAFFGVFYTILQKAIKRKLIVNLFLVSVGLYLSVIQIRQMWYQFIDIPAYISDEEILSREAGKYPGLFYIDENFGPAAIFYSGKNVKKAGEGSLQPLFNSSKQFLLITSQWRLDQSGIEPGLYRIIKSDRDKILVAKR